MISSGARGRGAIDGNASAGLVNTGLEVCRVGAVDRARRRARQHPELAQRRDPALRARRPGRRSIGGRSCALTWTRRTCWVPPARSTVTCLPATGLPSDAQLVASSSSMSRARLIAVAGHRRAGGAGREVGPHLHRQGRGPARTVTGRAIRAWPSPGAWAMKSYVPGTSCTWSVSARRRVGVGDRNRPGLVVADEQLGTRDGLPVPVDRRNVTVASFANGEVKLGVGLASPAPLLAAPSPRPRLANAFHSRSWFAPPKRIMSAASIASRESTMLTWLTAISRNESNISCAQRRLPGQHVTGVSPLAQDFCSAGVPGAVPSDHRLP